MFTATLGDPDRGERIAAAVLDDDEARAEVTAPITDAVLATTGLPRDRAPAVDAVVDRLLRDPQGARSFVDPFAGSWARLLGEDDPRPTEFDLTPLLDDVDALLAPLGVETTLGVTDARLEVPAVPLPRTELTWMGGVRRVAAGAVVPLGLIAVGLAAAAFLVGERRRVLRGVGIWAILAGAVWMVLPALLVWAARTWATGADAVVATSVDEATDDLRVTALVLTIAGAGLVVGSTFVPVIGGESRSWRPVHHRPASPGTSPPMPARPANSPPPTIGPPIDATRPVPTPTAAEPTRRVPVAARDRARERGIDDAGAPRTDSEIDSEADSEIDSEADSEIDSESVWNYYR